MMIDPVDNFKIPDEWVRLSPIPESELQEKISSGRFVLLSDGSLLKRGYTTGTTAAAASKAAVVSLKKEISEISVPTPSGIRVILSVLAENGRATIRKDSGDHAFDVTAGIEIIADAKEHDSINIIAGNGIGSKNGKPSINPVPMQQIKKAIEEGIREINIKGANVTISIPEGVNIARGTLNEKIGIIGGLSILGTTGFVEPWNEHLGEMKDELIKKADKVVLTTGRLGMRYSHILFPDYTTILIGSDISRGLKAAGRDVIIAGLPGLILKWANPDILKDTGYLTVQKMIEENPSNSLIDRGVEKVAKKSGKRVVLFNRDGTILCDSGEPV